MSVQIVKFPFLYELSMSDMIATYKLFGNREDGIDTRAQVCKDVGRQIGFHILYCKLGFRDGIRDRHGAAPAARSVRIESL